MKKIAVSEVLDLVEYEKVCEGERARVIALKKNRRVAVGENLTLLFENRDTVLFQIQEMVRAERIVDEARIGDEVDVYNALIPEAGELSATLFIEIPDLSRMSQEQVRQAVNRFQGLERGCVFLKIGDRFTVPARFEEGHSSEEKMAAVHYLRFALPPGALDALADPAQSLRLVVDHPRYRTRQEVPADVRAELLKDLQ
jgi:hypothetical protein